MSDEYDDFEDETEDSSNLVKDLRRQLKALKKQGEEQAAKVAAYEAAQRTSSVASLLEASGASPKLAKFYDSEDVSEAGVKAWIQDNAEVFGIRQPDPEPDNADQVRGIANALATAPANRPPGNATDASNAIRNAKNPDEFWAALQAAGLRVS